MKDIAQRGKSSTGWFYGFKLHLIINDQGEILSFMITPGNVDDRNSKVIFPLVKNIHDKNLPSPVLSTEKTETGQNLAA
ncbi:transposase, IS4-like family protein [Leptospira alexanderi serovar Manhao 3 str. L 60]|uniref:Transposase, IS4-like family protein n=1 Tax=Leptospira alexanderi serovar Manhao 3 str. L 60 TaxID=1049759 RepID=V6I6V5_9LEPT|nr:transposase, IS4-like family protein [Leptospira alexanderi serovar Manhao 3 str. L 60]